MTSTSSNSSVLLGFTKTRERPSTFIKFSFIAYYVLVLAIASVGNVLVIAAVFKYRRMRTVVNLFLVNLALSDLLFAALSVFDCIAFMRHDWPFGDLFCRLQGTLIEVSYTVSISTLMAVSAERYLAICHPYKRRRTVRETLYIIGLTWLLGLAICSALLYGYSESSTANGEGAFCENSHWGANARLLFYVVHSVFVYLLPLATLCVTHCHIWRAISRNKQLALKHISSKQGPCITCFAAASGHCSPPMRRATENGKKATSDGENRRKSLPVDEAAKIQTHVSEQALARVRRRSRVAKLLLVVIVTFLVLWTPFILTRLAMYLRVTVNTFVWRSTQLLILGSTASNCIIYACMSSKFRKAYRQLLTCATGDASDGRWSDVSQNSRSADLSSSRKQLPSSAKTALLNLNATHVNML